MSVITLFLEKRKIKNKNNPKTVYFITKLVQTNNKNYKHK